MTGELNEISQAIGQLQAQMGLMLPMVQEINEKVAMVPDLKDRVDKLEPAVSKNTKFRWGTLGIVALITVLFNALGGPIWAAIFR